MTFDPFTPIDEVQDTLDIDDMPNLSARLGSRRVKRIQYAQREHKGRPKRGRNTTNEVIDYMQGRGAADTFCNVNDIIAGVCRLDHYGQKEGQIPLSQSSVYMVLQCVEEINTAEIMDILRMGERQAQRYNKACRLAHNLIKRELERNEQINDPVIESGVSDVDI